MRRKSIAEFLLFTRHNEGAMTTPIKLDQFGYPITFNCRGTIKSLRLGGQRLLFLFGERHGIKPYIKLNLLNAVDLYDLGVLSCVGVEGRPMADGETFPRPDVVQEFQSQQRQYGGNTEAIIEAMLRWFQQPDFYFWNFLKLLRPSLPICCVEEPNLYARANCLNIQYNDRKATVAATLRQSDLFEFDPKHRECKIEEKANMQWEQEMAEEEVMRARDDQFIKAMRELWDKSGAGKVAILNAGTAHQYHIARLLPGEISYYHIEQP
jgi:hypothetical protein